MKGKMVFGALMLSVALCSQGMALDLLDNMSGLNAGGCNACVAPAPCAPAVKCCAPEPTCGPCCAPRCDLFAGLKDLFACRRCEPCGPCTECKTCAPEPAPCAAACGGCGECCECRPVRNLVRNVVVEPLHDLKCDLKAAFARPCCAPCGACAPVCEAPKACAPVCKPCKVAVCKPVCEAPKCCEAPKACAPACGGCGKCFRCRPVLTFIDNLFSALKPCRSCNVACGETCGCSACGATVVPGAPAPVPAAAPAPVAAPQEAAPLPAAPKADPSASLMRSRSIYQATASIVQN